LTLFKRGTVYLALGKTRFAVQDFSRVLELKPDFTAARIQRGIVLLQRKRERQYTGLFQCDSCPQRFNMKSALDRHMAVHSTDRLHACTHCSKRYKRAQDLKWHMKTHANEKPNVCDVCGKAFALKYVLTQHMRSHEGKSLSFRFSLNKKIIIITPCIH